MELGSSRERTHVYTASYDKFKELFDNSVDRKDIASVESKGHSVTFTMHDGSKWKWVCPIGETHITRFTKCYIDTATVSSKYIHVMILRAIVSYDDRPFDDIVKIF